MATLADVLLRRLEDGAELDRWYCRRSAKVTFCNLSDVLVEDKLP